MCGQSTYEETRPDRYIYTTSSENTELLISLQGDRIIVVVQKTRSMGEGGPGATSAAAANKVRRGDVRHAIIVRTAKKVQRKDGMVVRFDDNACALIGKNGEPLGTRINGEDCKTAEQKIIVGAKCYAGVVGAELRDKHQSKILSLSSMHV